MKYPKQHTNEAERKRASERERREERKKLSAMRIFKHKNVARLTTHKSHRVLHLQNRLYSVHWLQNGKKHPKWSRIWQRNDWWPSHLMCVCVFVFASMLFFFCYFFSLRIVISFSSQVCFSSIHCYTWSSCIIFMRNIQTAMHIFSYSYATHCSPFETIKWMFMEIHQTSNSNNKHLLLAALE